MNKAKRMHQCGDGVWRHASQFATAAKISMIKLDEDGEPTGEWQEVGTATCVHFSFEDE